MSHEELKFKESVLRECFKEKLEQLNVEGTNDMCTVKNVKTYGMLWHLTHQLLMAEEAENIELKKAKESVTSAETMNIQATGLKMAGSSK